MSHSPAWALAPNGVVSTATFLGNSVSRIDQFDADGMLLREFTVSGFVHGLSTDSAGHLYALTFTATPQAIQERVDQFVDGVFSGTVAGPTTDTWAGIAFDGHNRLYVGENADIDRILRFSSDGTPLGVFATVSTGAPGAPTSLVFDSAGVLYVPDHRDVERFDPAGQSLGTFASVLTGTSNFITSLAIDSHQRLYAATLQGEIHVFDPSGQPINTFQPSGTARYLEIDGDDVLFVAEANAVRRYTPSGSLIDTFVSNRPGEIFALNVYEPIPEPSSALLACMAAACAYHRRIA